MLEGISSLFGFMGGLGMFLYGMHIMADGMQKTAGGKMQKFLGMLTNNRFMAIGLGALITAIIQSSGATTVMVVGFVSAGVLNLTQAVGVIMGANIGTTITAWIVSMSQIGDSFDMMKPEFYAPALIGFGAILIVFSKSNKRKTIGEILIGLGLLFMGLKYMSGSIKPYTGLPIFSEAFRLLGSNPILGMIVGCVVTAILQSSSASVGILQTLAMNGVVSTNAAIYITLGQNIGSCVTALLSSMGSSRTAKRAAIIHLSFNMVGSLIFGIIAFIIFTWSPVFAASSINSVEISIFHTLFNTTNTLLLLPFANQLVKLSGIIIKDTKQNDDISTDIESSYTLRHLDVRIFETPAFAVETAIQEVLHMAELALNNVKNVVDKCINVNKVTKDELDTIFKTESSLNNMQNMLTEYLIKVDNLSLNDEQKLLVNNLFYTVSDIERVGDHAENIAENLTYLLDKNLTFSETAMKDLEAIGLEAYEAFYHAIDARKTKNLDAIRKVNKYEDEVDLLEGELREKHISRLSNGECIPEAGIIFLDIISNLERISDHAMNIAGYMKKEI